MRGNHRIAATALGAATLGLLAAGLLAASAACNAVLGIEHATFEDGGMEAATSGSPADGGAGATSDDGGELTCSNYCSTIMQNCTGVHQAYLSNDVCMTMCGYMAPGVFYPPSANPDNVDTLGCRLWHATVAPIDPTVHCRHAGPLGTELCGGPCKPFCRLDWRFCTDDHGINVYEGQVDGCDSVCEGDAGFDYVEGDSGDLADPSGTMIEMGNTLNCRLWHLETAISTYMTNVEPDRTTLLTLHCGHTGQVSATCQ